MAAISAACSTALRDSIWMMPRIRRLTAWSLRVALLPETCATRRQGEAAGAVGRVAHERDRLARLLRQVHPRDHDPVRTEVEGTTDAQPLARLRPDKGGGRCRAHRVEVGQQVGFGAGAVLEVDDQPVEAGAGHDLGRHRRSEAGERAVQRLPGSEPAWRSTTPGTGGMAVWSVMRS